MPETAPRPDAALRPMTDQETAMTIAYMNPGVSVSQAELVIKLLRRDGWASPAEQPVIERQVRDRAEEAERQRAEALAAAQRVRSELLTLAELCDLQAGHANCRGDDSRMREWEIVAEKVRKILDALEPPEETR